MAIGGSGGEGPPRGGPPRGGPPRGGPPTRSAGPREPSDEAPAADDIGYESTLKPATADDLGILVASLPPSPSAEASGARATSFSLEHTLAPEDRESPPPREDLGVTLPGVSGSSSGEDHRRAQILGTLRGVSGPSQPTEPLDPEADTVRGQVFGRYILLDQLGEGGMGMVYAAYDPELDRKIALKLVRAGAATGQSGARNRLLREAQAMAKLSHPNVVTVHDVGAVDERVYLAMEYIHGRTIDAWVDASSPPWRAIVDAFTQAGAGLSAAHAANLIHRDFKPQNVMVGDDGRVVVMDFGLARARSGGERERDEGLGRLTSSALDLEITHGGAILGTPAYMAPEQFEGAEADARSDLFAFCATLWRCLYGQPPFAGESFLDLADNVTNGVIDPPKDARGVPGWLRKVLERGLAVDAFARWPTMDALLEALANDPTRRRRLLFVAGGVAAIGLAALAATFISQRNARAECRTIAAQIDEVWGEGQRQAMRDGFRASEVSYANDELGKLVPLLDRWTAGWRSARRQVCLDDLEGRIDARRHAQALSCLREARLEVSSRVARLTSGAPEAVAAALEIGELPALDGCRDPEGLARRPLEPPRDADEIWAIRGRLAQASAAEAEGDLGGALGLAEAGLAEAERLQWPPLVALTRTRVGVLLTRAGDLARGEEMLRRAYHDARAGGFVESAADAALALVDTIGHRQARPREGRVWAEVGAAELAALGEAEGLRAATLALELGALASDERDLAAAEERFREALAIRERELGDDHLEVARALDRLGRALADGGRPREAVPLLERALELQIAHAGPAHPRVADALDDLGTALLAGGRIDAAEASSRRALAIRERAFGARHPEVARSLFNLGLVLTTAGRGEGEVIAGYTRALEILVAVSGEASPEVARARILIGEAELRAGRLDAAAASAEAARALLEGLYGPSAPLVAHALVLIASIERARGDLKAAERAADRALEIRAGDPQTSPAEVATARLIWAMVRADRGMTEEAAAAAEEAAAEATRAGPAGALLLREITAWRARQGAGEGPPPASP